VQQTLCSFDRLTGRSCSRSKRGAHSSVCTAIDPHQKRGMGEAAILAAAMDAAIAKATAGLCAQPHPSEHEAVRAHRRAGEHLRDAVAYYAPPRLPALLWARHTVDAGMQLAASGQHTLAAGAFYKPVCDLLSADRHKPAAAAAGAGAAHPPDSSSAIATKTALEHLELYVQARLGLAAARGTAALQQDPTLAHADTLSAVLCALGAARSAAADAIPQERLYHLVHDATVAIADLARPLVDAGLAGPALPHLVFAAKAGGAHLTLAAPRHLAWRTELYLMAVHCYIHALSAQKDEAALAGSNLAVEQQEQVTDGGAAVGALSILLHPQDVTAAHAAAFLEDGIQSIEHLVMIQGLDPIPPDPDAAAALAFARSKLLALRPLLSGAVTSRPATSAAPAPPPTAPTASQQQGTITGGAGRAAVQDAIKGLASDGARLTTLVSLLTSACSASSPLQRQPQAPPALQPVLEEVVALVSPALTALAALVADDTPRSTASSSSAAAAKAAAAAEPVAMGGDEQLAEAEVAAQLISAGLHQVGAGWLVQAGWVLGVMKTGKACACLSVFTHHTRSTHLNHHRHS